MTDLRLEEVSAGTAVAANSLTLKPGQEQFTQPVSHSMAEPQLNPTKTWSRVVLDGDEVIGLITGHFDADGGPSEFRSCILRIDVAATAQGSGAGRFAVLGLADEARSRGFDRLSVMYDPGEGGPEGFFAALGFRVEKETSYGEHFAVLDLG